MSLRTATALAVALVATPVLAQTAPAPTPAPAPGAEAAPAQGANPTVGGAEMSPSRTLIDNLRGSAEHRTFIRAVEAADLASTLSGPGPFTIFVPSDEAFGALPPATLEGLLQPQNKATLAQILTYHVVPQRLTYRQIEEAMEAGGGTARYPTINGQEITITREGNALKVAGQGGSVGYVGQYDIAASNGVFHRINGVLVPTIQAAPAAAAPAAPATGATGTAAAPGS